MYFYAMRSELRLKPFADLAVTLDNHYLDWDVKGDDDNDDQAIVMIWVDVERGDGSEAEADVKTAMEHAGFKVLKWKRGNIVQILDTLDVDEQHEQTDVPKKTLRKYIGKIGVVKGVEAWEPDDYGIQRGPGLELTIDGMDSIVAAASEVRLLALK